MRPMPHPTMGERDDCLYAGRESQRWQVRVEHLRREGGRRQIRTMPHLARRGRHVYLGPRGGSRGWEKQVVGRNRDSWFCDRSGLCLTVAYDGEIWKKRLDNQIYDRRLGVEGDHRRNVRCGWRHGGLGDECLVGTQGHHDDGCW